MAITNGYTTLDAVKARLNITETDAADDAVIERGIEQASRYIDAMTLRTFYARTETRYFDLPSGRELELDDDLLTVTTLTNGDGTVLGSDEYNLMPRNLTPYWAIVLKESSTYVWETDANSNTELVISVAGTWGYCASDPDAGTPVRAPHDIEWACEEIAVTAYKRRFGENTSGAVKITGAGVVIMPPDVSTQVREILKGYRRML